MPNILTAVMFHLGALDGSAGFAVSNTAFIGASDEMNVIQQHSTADRQQAVPVFDLNTQFPGFPTVEKKHGVLKEADLESVTKLGDLLFWIGSHSRDSGAVRCTEREVLFATRLSVAEGMASLAPEGKVYTGLLGDLTSAAALQKYRLKASAEAAPKAGPSASEPIHFGGFNIESLCAEHEGTRLFIGLRNPIPQGKALLVPLINAPALIAGADSAARFDEAVEMDLGGLGLRDMVWWRGSYLLIGGDFRDRFEDEALPSRLFQWSGKVEDKPVRLDVKDGDATLDKLNPEALIVFSDQRVLILSDDGAMPGTSGAAQKDELKDKVKPLTELGFRSVWLEASD